MMINHHQHTQVFGKYEITKLPYRCCPCVCYVTNKETGTTMRMSGYDIYYLLKKEGIVNTSFDQYKHIVYP